MIAHSQRDKTLWIIGLTQAILVYDFASTNIAVAALRDGLHFEPAAVPWIIGAYMVPFGSILLLGGRIGDVVGLRNVLFYGLTAFGALSILSALAPTKELFLATRALKGAAAALLAPASLALLNLLYQEGRERHRAIGFYGLLTSAGFAAGNLLGGILTSQSWRLAVGLNGIAAVIVLVLAWRWLPSTSSDERSPRLDWLGGAASLLGFGALLLAITEGARIGLKSPATLGVLVAAALGFATLAWQTRYHPDPLLPRSLNKLPVLGAAAVVFLLAASGTGAVFQLSLFLQDALHYSPQQTGIALIPFVLMAMLTSLFVPRALDRFGAQTVLVAGISVYIVAISWLLLLDRTSTYALGILPALLLMDIGYPLAIVAVRIPAASGVPRAQQGVANGFHFAAEQLGIAFGITLLAAVADATRAAAVGDGTIPAFQSAFATSVFLLFAALSVAALILSGQRKFVPDSTVSGAAH